MSLFISFDIIFVKFRWKNDVIGRKEVYLIMLNTFDTYS